MRPPPRSTPRDWPGSFRPGLAHAAAHKLTAEVVEFASQAADADPSLRSRDLVEAIRDRFGVVVHPRSVERALARARNPKSDSR